MCSFASIASSYELTLTVDVCVWVGGEDFLHSGVYEESEDSEASVSEMSKNNEYILFL